MNSLFNTGFVCGTACSLAVEEAKPRVAPFKLPTRVVLVAGRSNDEDRDKREAAKDMIVDGGRAGNALL